MKSRLAVWSWILPIIGVVQNFIFSGLFGNVKPPTPLAVRMFVLSDAIILWGFLITGLTFGIIALIKMKHNPELTGKVHAIIGIVLNILAIPLAFLVLLGPFMGD